MSTWVPVQGAAKNDAGQYMANVNGKWVPAQGAAKNDKGEYMAILSKPETLSSAKPEQPSDLGDYLKSFAHGMKEASIPGALMGATGTAIDKATNWINQQATRFGDWTLEKTGSPALATLAKMSPDIIPAVGGFVPAKEAAALGGKAISKAKGVLTKAGGEPLREQMLGEVAKARNIQEVVRDSLHKMATRAHSTYDTLLQKLSPSELPVEHLGLHIQNEGANNLKAARAATVKSAIEGEKDPAFARARLRAKAGDFPTNNQKSAPLIQQAVNALEQQIKDIPEGFRTEPLKELQALGFSPREVPLSPEDQRVEDLRASIENRARKTTGTAPPENQTLHQLEFLRRRLQDPLSREQSGFAALNANNMTRIGDIIRQAMIAYEPGVERYINAYREGKLGEEAITGGKESLLKDAANVEGQPIFNVKPQTVVSHYLDGTQTSAEKLVRLVGDKSKIDRQVGAYLRGHIADMTSEQASKFIKKNAGMLKVFPEFKAPLDAIAKQKGELERIGEAHTKAALDATSSLDASISPSIKRIKAASTTAEIAQNADRIADALKDKNFISEAKYIELKHAIHHISLAGRTIEQAKSAALWALGAAGAYEFLPGSHYIMAHTIGRIAGGGH